MFEYAFFHLFQTVVVTVQHALGCLDVQVVSGVFVPGEADNGLQVVELDVVVRALLRHPVEFGQFLVVQGAHILRHLPLVGFFAQVMCVFAFAVAEFVLQVAYLLLQEVFLLLLVNLFARPVLDGGFQVGELALAVEDADEFERALFEVVDTQEFHFLLDGERKVGADEIDEEHLVRDVADGEGGFVADALVGLQVAYGLVLAGVGHGVELSVAVFGQGVGKAFHAGGEVRARVDNFAQFKAAEALQDDRGRLIGQFEHAHHLGHGADGVQVVALRIVDRGVALADYTDIHPFAGGALGQFERTLAANDHRHYDSGEKHHVAEREDRQGLVEGDIEDVGYVSVEISNQGKRILIGFVLVHYSRLSYIFLPFRLIAQKGRAKILLFSEFRGLYN